MRHSEIDVKFLWDIISDFWNHFGDREIISQIWRGFLQSLSNLYYQLYQTSLSKSIETVPYYWLTDWEPITLDKSTFINTDSSIIYYKKTPRYLSDIDWEDPHLKDYEIVKYDAEEDNYYVISESGATYYKDMEYESAESDVIYYGDVPVTLSELDWDNPLLVYHKRNPDGVIRYDEEKAQSFVYDINGVSHYRSFPYEYTMPKGLKDATYLVETPRNGVKFSQKAFSSNGSVITYNNGMVRPFETEYLTDQHGFATEFVANGVLASGEPGTQDFIILPSGDSSISRICIKCKINNKMWVHVGIRKSYNLYESFGYLLRFFKQDNIKYLREIQGLWLSYFSSPTISALQRGFTVLRDLPFALQSGVITSLDQEPSRLIITHPNSLFLLDANEDTTILDPRNDSWNKHDFPILTDHLIYEEDGSPRIPVDNPELEAKPFVEQSLDVGDYIYSMNDEIQVVTFSFKDIEKPVPFPLHVFRESNARTVLSSFVLDGKNCIRLADRIISTYVDFNLPPEGTVLRVDDYDRVVDTPFPKSVFDPAQCGDIITEIVADGTESYIELNNDTKFILTEHEAKILINENIVGYSILYVNGNEVIVGSLANVKLDHDTYYQLYVGDYISFISPAKLNISINGTPYTYYTDSTLSVAYGQYINKYDPIVSTVKFKDYITDPNWPFDEIGNVNVTNQKALETIIDMWHSFVVEVDEYSVPDTFETSRLIHNFIKSAKPTYVDYKMIANFYFEDTLNMSDEFSRDPRYEFIFEYPWAGRGLLIFDNDCFFDDYHFDDDQRFEDSDFADPMWVWPIRDTLTFEDRYFRITCLDDGMLLNDGHLFNASDGMDSLSLDTFTPDGDVTDTYFQEAFYDNTMLFDTGCIFDVTYDEVTVHVEH